MTTISLGLPETHFIAPSSRELLRLYEIATAAHPHLKSEESRHQFGPAFWMTGFQFRLPAPSKRHTPEWLLEQGNVLLARHATEPVGLGAYLLAIVAHADIPWQKQDLSKGAVLAGESHLKSRGGIGRAL